MRRRGWKFEGEARRRVGGGRDWCCCEASELGRLAARDESASEFGRRPVCNSASGAAAVAANNNVDAAAADDDDDGHGTQRAERKIAPRACRGLKSFMCGGAVVVVPPAALLLLLLLLLCCCCCAFRAPGEARRQ